jgi:putative ABC transport system permease protein
MRGGPGSGALGARPFSLKDNDLLQEQIPAIDVAAPIAQGRARAIWGNANWRTDVVGTDNRYFRAARWELAAGRLFLPAELQSGRSVCVIGETVRKELFGGVPALGEKIRLEGLACEVIGVTRSKGASTFGSDQDDFVILPLRTYHRRIAGNTDVGFIYVSIREEASISRAMEEITTLMREIRRIGLGEEDDFEVLDMRELATLLTGITSVLAGLLAAVAGVSLLVGGIGIMNIMLVSVTERTREIGIRLAIGAQARQVLIQFLVEAIVLSSLGGLLGIALGLGFAFLGAQMLAIPFEPDPGVILLAFGFSAVVGVVFGYFPARRAARMSPIDALRYE